MTQRRHQETMTEAVILLGIISMVIGAYDGVFQAWYSLRWTGLPDYIYKLTVYRSVYPRVYEEVVFRLLSVITTLPVLLCAAFASAGKKKPALVCGIGGAALHAVMAIGTVVPHFFIVALYSAIENVAMAVICLLIIITMDGRHQWLGYVILAIAVLSLVAILVIGPRMCNAIGKIRGGNWHSLYTLARRRLYFSKFPFDSYDIGFGE